MLPAPQSFYLLIYFLMNTKYNFTYYLGVDSSGFTMIDMFYLPSKVDHKWMYVTSVSLDNIRGIIFDRGNTETLKRTEKV